MPLVIDSLETLAKMFDELAKQAAARGEKSPDHLEPLVASGEVKAYTNAARIIRQTQLEH